jgi:uncharacterized protein (TIGR03435 family)
MKFEVASVRPHRDVNGGEGVLSISGPRLTIRAFRPRGLLTRAFRVKDFQISSATPLDQTLYDIEATAGNNRVPTEQEMLLMLQSLLAERFKLRFHRQVKEMPVYGLIVGKNGPSFSRSAPDASPAESYEIHGPNITVISPMGTMEGLAERIRLNAGLDRQVVNMTGLDGSYRIRLTYAPKRRMSGGESDLDAVNIFTAVQDQLGLKLESRTALIDILVIDHMERPSEN